MQSGSCSLSHSEMASKRMKTFIFNDEKKKIKNEEVNSLETASTKDISISRKASARDFLKQSKLIHYQIIFKKSAIWFL